MNYICVFPFYALWLILSGYIIKNGLHAIQQRKIIYRWWTPLGRMVVTMRGDGVSLIGGVQMFVGGTLCAVILANILQWNQVSAFVSLLFLASAVFYGGLVWWMRRWLEVESLHIWR